MLLCWYVVKGWNCYYLHFFHAYKSHTYYRIGMTESEVTVITFMEVHFLVLQLFLSYCVLRAQRTADMNS